MMFPPSHGLFNVGMKKSAVKKTKILLNKVRK
ncbi:unknown [[Mannheimia] succiniciproducens MBEL55E]|uniref:Uncharacterized protein n=1 Tax=Mannheimia succiniciproducens (strain KCTC 0769BP / MBEL55E) TaxID=221988 RepID=Q65QU8_MANSM|nr:unknown [[Mannheimia] succiniciproducens MBEL55E]